AASVHPPARSYPPRARAESGGRLCVRPPRWFQVFELGAEEICHLAELAPLLFDLVQLGGQHLSLLAVVQGAGDVRGGDGGELGEGEADRLGDLDALDELNRAFAVVGVKPGAGPACLMRHQAKARVETHRVAAHPSLPGDFADEHRSPLTVDYGPQFTVAA